MIHRTLMIRRTLVSTLLVVTAGCVSTSPQPDPEEMYQKAAALTKVTAMVESLVTYSDVALNADLLAAATGHDPEILKFFEGYELRAGQTQGRGAVVMCTQGGGEALLLDVGCTAKLDYHWWQTEAREPCEVPLDAAAVCPR